MTSGLCECGCGRPTRVSRWSNKTAGYVKGQPRRFVRGHHYPIRKAETKSYRTFAVDGRVERLHRIRAERALGKPLPKGAEVHHVDGTRGDHSQLVICQDRAYHVLLHARARVVKAGGDPNIQRMCCECRLPKANVGANNMCRPCHATKMRQYLRLRQQRQAS